MIENKIMYFICASTYTQIFIFEESFVTLCGGIDFIRFSVKYLQFNALLQPFLLLHPTTVYSVLFSSQTLNNLNGFFHVRLSIGQLFPKIDNLGKLIFVCFNIVTKIVVLLQEIVSGFNIAR